MLSIRFLKRSPLSSCTKARLLGVLLVIPFLSSCGTDDSIANPDTPTSTLREVTPTTTDASTDASLEPTTSTPLQPTTTLSPAEHFDESNSDNTNSDIVISEYYETFQFQLPRLEDHLFSEDQPAGEPFGTIGPKPPTIVASTKKCEIVLVDSATAQLSILWTYPNPYRDTGQGTYFGCGASDFDSPEFPTEDIEITATIDDIEWIEPNHILIGICCEPAAGRSEILDISGTNEPLWLALDASVSDINDDGTLLFSSPFPVGGYSGAIGSVDFDIELNSGVPGEYPDFYSLRNRNKFFILALHHEDHSNNISGIINNVSWVDGDQIAFDLWSYTTLDSGIRSWIGTWVGIIDLKTRSTSLNSRSQGWTLPTGDAFGNLVVVEQSCSYLIERCEATYSTLLVIDSRNLLPIHAIVVDGAIADMDLTRGWLLVTLTDGRMGTINLINGMFTVIAEQITYAAWME